MNFIEAFKAHLDKLESTDFPNLWEDDLFLKRNQFLTEKGSHSPYLYFIESGALRIFYQNETEDLTIRFGYKNSFVLSLPSFLTNGASEYYIQAIRASHVKSIHKKMFYTILEKDKILADFWRQGTEQLIIEQLEREIDILTTSPAQRFERVLKRSPQLFQEIPLKYIASYLRMTPETLSRLRKK
jgi:CRP-like cAMP-binding protein